MTAQVYHGTDRLGTRPPASAAPAPTTSSSTSRGDAYPAFGYIRPTNTFPSTRSPPLIPPDDRPSSQLGWAAGADAVRGIMTFCVPLSPCFVPRHPLQLRFAYHHPLPSPCRPALCAPPLLSIPAPSPLAVLPLYTRTPAPRAPRATLAAVVPPCARAAAQTTRDCGERRPICPQLRAVLLASPARPRYDGCPAPHSGDEMQPVDLPIVFLVSPCVVPISARVYVYVSFAQALKWFFGRA
ncbi:hypothetical protein C8R44DRAFT_911558 [Mycena epipterygia]|nr:hypothetical protein C8R44DRAFT_911558 [Mycena epipterygia]